MYCDHLFRLYRYIISSLFAGFGIIPAVPSDDSVSPSYIFTHMYKTQHITAETDMNEINFNHLSNNISSVSLLSLNQRNKI